MSNEVRLSARLSACASLVNDCARLCDVGCDHGYVPVALVLSGKIKSAVACDINEGPLASCKRLVDDYDLGDSINCVLSDGLQNVSGEDIDDILLAGMGGELISDILERCPYAKEKHIIINAMTHPELSRKWLYDNGFKIINDLIVPDGRHHYSVLDAVYTGEIMAYTEADCFLGEISDFSDREYFVHLLNYLRNKQKGGTDYSEIIKLIEDRI